MLRIGKIEHGMEGCACPMGAVAREFLNRLTADPQRWVLVDTEAGIEHFVVSQAGMLGFGGTCWWIRKRG